MALSFELVGLKELNAKLDRLPPALQVRVLGFIGNFTNRLRDQVKANIADRFKSEGPLFQSVRSGTSSDSGIDGGTTGRVYTEGVPYAQIQEEGGVTAPHVIEAINGRMLAFMAPARMGLSSGGGMNGLVFARKANHPGSRIPERSYARLALVQLRAPFEGGIREVVDAAIGDAMGGEA